MFRKAANHSTGYPNGSQEGATMVGLVSTSNFFKEPLLSSMYDDVYQGQDPIYRGIPLTSLTMLNIPSFRWNMHRFQPFRARLGSRGLHPLVRLLDWSSHTFKICVWIGTSTDGFCCNLAHETVIFRHPRMGILFFAWAVTSWTRQVSQVNRGNKLKGSWWLRSEGPPTTFSYSSITWWIPVAPWRCEDVDVAGGGQIYPCAEQRFLVEKKEAAKVFLGDAIPTIPSDTLHPAKPGEISPVEPIRRVYQYTMQDLGKAMRIYPRCYPFMNNNPARLSNIVLEDWDK